MKKSRLHIVLSLTWGVWTSGVFAREEDYGRDVREECRARLAGLFLSAHNDLKMAEDATASLEEKAGSLKKGEATAEQQLQSARKETEKKDYDAARLESLEGAKFRLAAIREQASQNQHLLGQAKKELSQKKQDVEKMKVNLSTLFTMTPVTVGKDGGYSFDLQYRHKCSQFQNLCPLPISQATSLSHLFPKEVLPESCWKYSQIRQP